MTSKRPNFITGWREIEAPAAPPSSPEDFGFASELSAATGINHFRVAHLRIPPGKRGYPPMAMDDLEIFSFVLEGAPDLWADGHLHRLEEGDGVTFNARTGLAHTLINNTDRDVRLFVMTEAFRRNSRATHPLDPAGEDNLRKMNMFWANAPKHKLGPNKGAPGDKAGRKRVKPDFVAHWRDLLTKKAGRYLTPGHWRYELETAQELCSGAVIWSPWTNALDQRWVNTTAAFLGAGLKA